MKFTIVVRGNRDEWAFDFDGDEAYWQDWLDDGLEVYAEDMPEEELYCTNMKLADGKDDWWMSEQAFSDIMETLTNLN